MKSLLATILRASAPSLAEARTKLANLRLRTGGPRAFVAGLLCVPAATKLRRWEDGTRCPSRAACQLIGTQHAAVDGLKGLPLVELLVRQSVSATVDDSLPAAERIKAAGVVNQALNLMVG